MGGGWAAASLAVHDGWRYDLRFDTMTVRPEAIAADVLRTIGTADEP